MKTKGKAYAKMMHKAALKATQICTPWGPIMMDQALILGINRPSCTLNELPGNYRLKKGDVIIL